MKLTINRQDIIDAFVARTGVEPHQIEINVEVEPAPVVTSLNNPAVRDALRSFFHQGSRKACGEIISRIDLIKAVRTLCPGSSLKEAKDFVEDGVLATPEI